MRPEVDRFIEWFGADKPMAGLRAGDVAAYEDRERERIGHDDLSHLEPLRAFLAYCSRLAFTDANLVPSLHLPDRRRGRGAWRCRCRRARRARVTSSQSKDSARSSTSSRS